MASIFELKAPRIMDQLIADLGLGGDGLDAAAIVGNFGLESGGFEKLQEIKPTVKGSRGGYGWPQWTGPRRKAYEAWCADKDFDPASDEANYGYVLVELRGAYASVLGSLKRAKSLKTWVAHPCPRRPGRQRRQDRSGS
jgi:hypothetical protein